jgi:hypothetical protein
MFQIDREVLYTVIVILVISLISGLNSLVMRMRNGYKFNLLWFISEYSMCILFGFLAHDVYPKIQDHVGDWMTVWIFVAVAAHVGGRFIQIIEGIARVKYNFVAKSSDNPPSRNDEQ